MDLNQRRQSILLAVIESYLSAGTPVSSRWLTERCGFTVSSATIRNELGRLEEMGMLTHPYTSAGRVPTDRGYRYYVDTLGESPGLSDSERRFLERFFKRAGRELDELMAESSTMLSEMTECLAVVTAPLMKGSRFKHLELVKLTADTALMVLITDTGRVEKSVFSVGEIGPERLDEIASQLNALFGGREIIEIRNMIRDVLAAALPDDFILFRSVVSAIAGSAELDSGRVFTRGADHLANFGHGPLRSEVIIDEIRRSMGNELLADFLVRIGSENENDEMRECTLIARRYGTVGRPYGFVSVVGPRRMDYGRVLALVEIAARSLSEKIKNTYEA